MNNPVWSGGAIAKDDNENRFKPTVEFQNIVNQLLSELQTNFGEDGIQIPTAAATDIASRLSFMGVGSMLFDTTNNVLVLKTGSGLQQVTTTPYP